MADRAGTGVRYSTGAYRAKREEPAPGSEDDLAFIARGFEFFPTPPWATRALCETLDTRTPELARMTAWDPCAGAGHMALALSEYFSGVSATDVVDYRPWGPLLWPVSMHNFLTPARPAKRPDWIVMNPPFNHLGAFITRALASTGRGVAVLMRMQALEGRKRHAGIWSKHPPTFIAQFVERVPMVQSRLDPESSTATAYAWVVWAGDGPTGSTRFKWIEPCRKRLEKPADYREEWVRRPIQKAEEAECDS